MVGHGFLAMEISEFLWVSSDGDRCVLVGF